MAFSGGGADKEGNWYESLWAVLEMLRVLDEKASSIAFERPGLEGEGVEFAVMDAFGTLFYQAKRQNKGNWTLNRLQTEGVLKTFFEKLDYPDTRCKFVSTHPADSLDLLSRRAKKTESVKEYVGQFITGKELKTDFEDLRYKWNECTEEIAWQKLRRIEVVHVSEAFLEQQLEDKISVQIEGDAVAARTLLADYVVKRIYEKTVLASEIWAYLETHGFMRRNWHNDPRIRTKVDNINRRYLGSNENQTIRGYRIPRAETPDVLSRMANLESKKCLILSGVAGVGKSGVMIDVFHAIKNQGWEVLAFRLDRLENAQSPKAIGKQLDELPDSPAHILAALAHGQKAVLMIDQLDAVSISSGRNTDFYDSVLALIRQAKQHPNLVVILACRKFDLQNDYRFRQLVANELSEASEMEIQKLSREEMLETLRVLDIKSNGFTDKQLNLLSTPLHLKLLGESLEPNVQPLKFQSVNDLYSLFWAQKEQKINSQPKHPNWIGVIDLLNEKMSQTQTLSVPEICLDNFEHWKTMVSEGLLLHEAKRVAFFHEGFFDYAFARRFASTGGNLKKLLLSDEQLLLRRGQIRQILTQERDVDFEKYLENLEWLLFDSAVRFHVRQGVVALLSTIIDPKIEEWQLLSRLLGSENSYLVREVELALHDYQPWFELLDQLGIFKSWLESENETQINRAIWLLQTAQIYAGQRVAELIKPFLGVSDDWNAWLVFIFRFEVSSCRELFEVFLELLKLNAVKEEDFWMKIQRYPVNQPEWTCEALGVFLDQNILPEIQRSTRANEVFYSPNSDDIGDIFVDCAESAPLVFLKTVLEFIRQAASVTLWESDQKFQKDNIWGFHYFMKSHDEFPGALIQSVILALKELFKQDFYEFQQIFTELRRSNLETIQSILVSAIGDVSVDFADEAILFLCENPERFSLGFYGSPEKASHDLLAVMTPFASPETLRILEKSILSYYPEIERKYGYGSIFGKAQYSLLLGVEPLKLTPALLRRKQELDRKFPNHQIVEQNFWSGDVTSPIPHHKIEKMTDENILSAMTKYSEEKTFSTWGSDSFVGGASNFSYLIRKCSKSNPERFFNLLFQMPVTLNKLYFCRILEGLGESTIPPQEIFRAFLFCHGVFDNLYGLELIRVVECLIKRDFHLPEEILKIVASYAVLDPDPKTDRWKRDKLPLGSEAISSIQSQALSAVRSEAAGTIANIIWNHPEHILFFKPTIELLITDSVVAVRYAVSEILAALSNANRDYAVSLFLKLCQIDEIFLATDKVIRFLKYVLRTHFAVLQPLLEQMLSSEIPEVVRAGARLACVTSFDFEEAEQLAQFCLAGSTAQRLGAADVYSINLKHPICKNRCDIALRQLFFDLEQQVREEASDCFQTIPDEVIEQSTTLIELFISSPAFKTDKHLLYTLRKSAARIPDVVLSVCERFFEITGDEAGDIQKSIATDAHLVSELIIRTYAQQLNASYRNPVMIQRSLDLIDRMLEIRVFDAEKILETT